MQSGYITCPKSASRWQRQEPVLYSLTTSPFECGDPWVGEDPRGYPRNTEAMAVPASYEIGVPGRPGSPLPRSLQCGAACPPGRLCGLRDEGVEWLWHGLGLLRSPPAPWVPCMWGF